jgi:hypothetical protein
MLPVSFKFTVFSFKGKKDGRELRDVLAMGT